MDLLCGIGPWHIRKLCDPPWIGGNGYTPREAGDLTLDQVYMLRCDDKVLRKSGPARTTAFDSIQVVGISDGGGLVKGRDKDGNPMKAVIKGESMAKRLAREAQERRDRGHGS